MGTVNKHKSEKKICEKRDFVNYRLSWLTS